MFCPPGVGSTVLINGCVTRERLIVPNCCDSNAEPCHIVMKDGNATDLTVERLAGLEAYLCDELGVESVELAIYNYDLQSGPFTMQGDSGSLIFNGEGQMVGILHSGIQNGVSNHVTFATRYPCLVGHSANQMQISGRRLQPCHVLKFPDCDGFSFPGHDVWYSAERAKPGNENPKSVASWSHGMDVANWRYGRCLFVWAGRVVRRDSDIIIVHLVLFCP